MNRKWGHSITDAVKAAVEGGATIVQLRLVILLWLRASNACLMLHLLHACNIHFFCIDHDWSFPFLLFAT